MKRLLPTPISILLIVGAMAVLRVVSHGYQTAFAADAPEAITSSVTSIIGFLTTIGTFVIFVAGLVWWVIWGRNNQQLKDSVAGWKDTAERLRIENAELKAEASEAKVEKQQAEDEAERLRKANLRLQGLRDE